MYAPNGTFLLTIPNKTEVFTGVSVAREGPIQPMFYGDNCYSLSENNTLKLIPSMEKNNTIIGCIRSCRGYKYAGVKNSKECLCGNMTEVEDEKVRHIKTIRHKQSI